MNGELMPRFPKAVEEIIFIVNTKRSDEYESREDMIRYIKQGIRNSDRNDPYLDIVDVRVFGEE